MSIPYPTTTNTFQAVGYDSGTVGNDRVLTDNVSNTFVSSGAGDDYITATNWNLNINGGDGNDVLEVADSNIALTGGAGVDYFVFDSALVADLPGWITEWGDILDYTDGTDKIAILNVAGVTNYAALQPYMTQVGSDVRISITGQFAIDVMNTSLASLDATDFTFSASGGGGGGGTTVTVSSIADLRAAIADPNVTTILVAPGSYTFTDSDPTTTWGEAGVYINRDVTIRSAGTASADFHAGFDMGKGLFVTGPDASVTFDNIGFYDTRTNFGWQSGSANYAGIRFQGDSTQTLTVLNSYFENNFNAIKSNSNSGALWVDNTTFHDNGSPDGDGQEHQIYWEGTSVHIEDSNFDTSGSGHSIKTVVSEFTEILRNYIVDGIEGASHINVTGGGILVVEDNTIIKNTNARSANIIEYETMRAGGMEGAITITGNTITSNFTDPVSGQHAVLIRNQSGITATVSGNIINGIYEDNYLNGDTAFTNNTVNGMLSADISWQGSADQLTSSNDTLFLTGTSGNYLTGWTYQATNAGAGDDLVVASPDYDGTDIFYGGIGADTLAGGDGADFLYGGDGIDVLFSGSCFNGAFFGDQMFGGAGNDFLTVGPLTAGEIAIVTMDGGIGDDVLDGRTAYATALLGGAGNDTLLGSATPNDSFWDGVNGGDGDDVVFAGYGREGYIYGGDGSDIMVYAGAYGVDLQVSVAYGNLYIDPLTTAGENETSYYGETISQFEYIQFSNGVYNVATGVFTAGQTLVSLASLLAITAPSYPGAVTGQSITGTAAADTLNGASGNDTLTGLGSDDTLNGNDGNDLIRITSAADGFDVIDGGAGSDTVSATAANAVIGLTSIAGVETVTAGGFAGVSILGSTAANTLDFTATTLTGITKIDGGAGADVITGSIAADTILGSAGNDTLNGGDGDDSIQYTGTANDFDAVNGGAGTDTIAALANNAVIGLASVTAVETITAGAFTGVSISGSGNADTLNFSAVTLTGITAINGGLGNDSITGNAVANTINGGDGNDTLAGGDGNDALTGGAGINSIDGGVGTDLAIYAGNKVTYVVTLNANGSYTLTGGGITDTLTGIENVQFSDGTFAIGTLVSSGLTLTGTAAAEVLTGGAGADTITGLGGNDTINAGDGNDVIRQSGLGDGYDVIDGGLGSDTLAATAANTAIGITSIANVEAISSGGFAGVYVRGGTAAETLNFTGMTLTGITFIDGGSGNDSITGTAAADTIRGSGGNDLLSGGDGNDVFQFTGTGEMFDSIDGGLGTDTIIALTASTVIGLTNVANVESITANGLAGVYIAGSTGADVLNFSATTLTGITKIDGAAGADNITGSAAADTIIGGAGADTINAGDGNDTLQVSGTTGEMDVYNGGLGTDTLVATAASTVIGLASLSGVETVSSGGFAGVSILLSTGADSYDFTGTTLTGITKINAAGGNDTVTGSIAADTIVGGAGNDVLSGGDGNDVFQVTGTGDGLDIYSGGTGTDTVIATAANTVIGLLGASTIETFSSGGFAGVSILLSTGADSYNFNGNTLTGITKIDAAAGNDTVTGSAAADTLMGGTGQDLLTGAGGADHFAWDDGQFGTNTEAGADRVTDFTVGSDKLNLSLVDANTANGTGTDEAFSFIGTAAFSNVAGQLRYQQINGNTYAMGDQNGDGAADFWIRLDGLKTLTATDFIL